MASSQLPGTDLSLGGGAPKSRSTFCLPRLWASASVLVPFPPNGWWAVGRV